jgi:hypothetical protein
MYTIYSMLFVSILHHYILWHYTRAFSEILHVWTNFFWFTINFFSLPQLAKSFFSPWKRMTEERGETFSFENLASFVIINLISRIIGMILRTIIILTGIITLLLLSIGIVVTYALWITAPLLIISSLYFGILFIFFK